MDDLLKNPVLQTLSEIALQADVLVKLIDRGELALHGESAEGMLTELREPLRKLHELQLNPEGYHRDIVESANEFLARQAR